jgi:ribosomal protein S18 acetylase RimI-like enzyme
VFVCTFIGYIGCAKKGIVLGMVEVDARPSDTNNEERDTNGPYMCNLAVDDKCQRRGIASALVKECERQVQAWYEQNKTQPPFDISSATFMIAEGSNEILSNFTAIATMSNSLSLKVRESNRAAIQLYTKLGYQSLLQETEKKTGEIVLVMRKQFSKRTNNNNISKNEAI